MRSGIVCSGVSCIDLLLYGAEPLVTRESLSMVRETQYRPGGATSNTGRALARLGVPVEYMTVIGADANGELLLKLWQADGVDTRYVVRTEEAGTALSTVPVYQDGKRGVYFYPGTNAMMSLDNMFGSVREHLQVLRERQAFHLGYPPLLPCLQGDRLAEMLSLVRKTGVFISLDTTPIADDATLRAMLAPAFPVIHLFKSNIEEAAQVVGRFSELHARAKAAGCDIEKVVTLEDIYAIGGELLAMGVPIAVLTLGPSGACICTSDEAALRDVPLLPTDLTGWTNQRLFVPAYQVDGPLNSAGAGDTFTAALLAGLCEGLPSIQQVVQLAHATAALHVDLSRGACRLEEVLAMLPGMRIAE
ncbi:MAG: carbohydrate kinase family protein [Armatimonadota bacterium]